MSTKKRFTDANKWKRTWFQELSRDAKLLWIFLCDDCDHAGVWLADFQVMTLRLGITMNENKLRELVGDKIVKIDTDKYFIPSYFEFQYGDAKEGFKAKQSALKTLRAYNLVDDNDSLIDFTNSYLSVQIQSPDCHIIIKSKIKSNTGIVKGADNPNLATDEDREAVYKLYTNKRGKADGLERLKKRCPTKQDLERFKEAMLAYLADCAEQNRFVQQFSTFANSNFDEWLDPEIRSSTHEPEESNMGLSAAEQAIFREAK